MVRTPALAPALSVGIGRQGTLDRRHGAIVLGSSDPAFRSSPMIVVGVDGSPSSVEALRWAVRQARLTGSSVDAHVVWSYPMVFGFTPPYPPDWDPQHDAEDVLTAAVTAAVKAEGDCEVRQHVSEGQAGPVLVEQAKGAELLVVGSRGHGLVAGVLLGSVSE